MEIKILGIDEAGRGCVLGPMVLCGVVCFSDAERRLAEIGVRDSKELTRIKRENFVDRIKKVIGDNFRITEVHPHEIDRENLNTIGIKKTIEMIEGFTPDRVYLDVPARGRGIKKYCNRIKNYLGNREVEIIGENMADKKYPVVSAASILAKVHRDSVIDRLKEQYEDFGSGYPSDVKTRDFLEKYYRNYKKFPEGIVRMKWKTVEAIWKK